MSGRSNEDVQRTTQRDAAQRACWICGKAICLETCATDEQGCAVHEWCYVAKLAFGNEFVRSNQTHASEEEEVESSQLKQDVA